MTAVITELAEQQLAQLHRLATVVLGQHQNDHDLCAVCGCAWPCERVLLAEHNLDLD
jgi:hypothetical protein